MLKEKQRLEEQILSLQNQISACPEGNIYCARNGSHYKWYYTDGQNHRYLPKRERKFAEQLAVKKYLSALLNDAVSQKRAIDFYLRHHPSSPGKAQTMLAECPEYRNLLHSRFTPLSQELDEWQHADYQRNPYKPEHLTIKAASGNYVRSKSEALIDMALLTNKIPFRYECELHLGDVVIYPDFTIRHPVTGQTFYFEHFGLMDKLKYRNRAGERLQLYVTHGIFPNVQLLTTYETQDAPLSVTSVNNLIQSYFL